MHQHDRGDHHATDPDGPQPGEEAQDEEDRSAELGRHDQDGDHGRKTHLGESLDGRGRTVSTEPPEYLLRAVHEEHAAEKETHHECRVVVVGADECICHVPSRPDDALVRAGIPIRCQSPDDHRLLLQPSFREPRDVEALE